MKTDPSARSIVGFAGIPPNLRDKLLNQRSSRCRDALLRHLARAGERSSPFEPIDYDFRPASYWLPTNPEQTLANIKGAIRKRKAIELLASGHVSQADDALVADTLTDDQRVALGGIHPALMGGEYLPDYDSDEVEIARVTLASITQDVIAIRARLLPEGGIRYGIVDEYETGYRFSPKESAEPLNLRQIIDLIESADSDEFGGICLNIVQCTVERDNRRAEDYLDFLKVTSEFYRELHRHYWLAIWSWFVDSGAKPDRLRAEASL